ncbi:MAG: ABC transporter permease [Acidobacteriota bacterium]
MSTALLTKEIRTRMRGKTVFILQNLYLLLLFGILLLMLQDAAVGEYGWIVGRSLFEFILGFQLVVLILIGPSITASAITMERDQRTWDLLTSTPLTMKRIVWSKFVASLSYLLVLLCVSLPGSSICLILGGTSPTELLFAYLLSALAVFAAGAVGLYVSSCFHRTIASVPVAGASILFLFAISSILVGQLSDAVKMWNPLYAFGHLTGSWGVSWYRSEIPFWVPSFVLLTLSAFALIETAEQHAKLPERADHRLGKLLTFLLIASAFLFQIGGTYPDRLDAGVVSGWQLDTLAYVMRVGLLLMLVFPVGIPTPIDHDQLRRRARRSLLWRFFGGNLLAGGPFILLLSATVLAVLWVSSLWLPAVPEGASQMARAAALICAVLAFFGSAGLLLSFTPRLSGRFVPRLILGVLLAAVLFLPPYCVQLIHRDDEGGLSYSRVDALYLMSPTDALWYLRNPTPYLKHPFVKTLSNTASITTCTTVLYFGLSALLLILLRYRLRSSRP